MFYLVFYISKFIKFMLKLFGKNATFLPGDIAIKLYPKFLGKVAKPKVIIGVTGTNGKTTVVNLLYDFFESKNKKVLCNKYGSNVNSGIASLFISGTNLFNKTDYEVAILELDERSSPKILPYVKLDYLICTNLFRDSIKRNAHSEFIFDMINNNLSKDTKLILNADDLISSNLGTTNKKTYFSIGRLETDLDECENIINDVVICPKCNHKLKYEYVKYHHIGKAHCPNCDFKSPDPDYLVTKVDYDKEQITVKNKNKSTNYKMVSNSVFNVYNMVCVIAFLKTWGFDDKDIIDFYEKEKIVETRYKEANINGIKVISHMAKGQNPIACSCVFDYVRKQKGKKELILLLYDKEDAETSSENLAWIYDCDFEFLNDESIEKILVCGHRAADINFRLLLAGIPQEKIIYEKEEKKIPDHLSLKKENTIYILYDMYEQPVLDNLNKFIEEKIVAKGDSENEN